MDEAGRFLRYVIPGLVSLLVVMCFLFISEQEQMVDLFKQLTGGMHALAALLTVFLGSGALGYIYAQIYFALATWEESLVQDHRSLFGYAGCAELLQARLPSSDKKKKYIDKNSITRRQAWAIVSRYWYAQIKDPCGKDFKGLDSITARLTHMIHSNGSSAVGVALVLPIWLLIHCCLSNVWPCDCWPAFGSSGGSFTFYCHVLWSCAVYCLVSAVVTPMFVIILGVWAVLLVVFWTARGDAQRKLEELVNSHFRERLKDRDTPVELFYEGK